MAGIYSQGGSAGHRYAGWLETVEAKNFQFGGKVFNGSPSAIYVGSNLVWAPWLLKDAAIRAILGAFGQRDGMAVINATNAYLNQLAASGQAGKDKATALAGFINEDPMMVCSLGLEVEGVTMPIRYLVGNGSSYIDFNQRFKNTGLPIDAKMQVMRAATISRNQWLMGNYSVAGTGASCFEFAIRANDVIIWAQPDASILSYSQAGPVNLHFRLSNPSGRQIGINGTDTDYAHTQATIFNNSGNYITLFGCVQESVGMTTLPIGHTELTLGSTELDLYPFKDKTTGNMEMINLNTEEYEHRIGTFTEAFYLPDGTPWTPSTP